MNDIGHQLGMNLMKYLRHIHAYIMRSSHQHLKPTLLAVTEFVFQVLDPIRTCTQTVSQVVQTIIECVDSYHSVEREAESAAPPLPPEGDDDPTPLEGIIFRDNNCTADSAAAAPHLPPGEGNNDVHVDEEEPPVVEDYPVQNGNEHRRLVEEENEVESIDTTKLEERACNARLEYKLTRAEYSYNEVCFKPGENLSPYWMKFLKERIKGLFNIKDLYTFSHNNFVMRNEHIFGKEFRENCAERAWCDHVVFSVHQDAFEIPDGDKGLRIRFLHKQRSPFFKLPPRKATGGSAKLPIYRMIFNESVLRRFSRAIAYSVIWDAGNSSTTFGSCLVCRFFSFLG